MQEPIMTPEDGSLLTRFLAHWDERGTGADVVGFVEAHPEATHTEQLELLLADQARRWRAGDRRLVEFYCRQMPWLDQRPELKTQLVVEEFGYRLEAGERVAPDEFLARFPELDAPHWRAQLESLRQAAEDLEPPGLSSPAPASGDRASLPSQIGRYRIIRLLGTGAFGRVYRAYDDLLARDVTIKVASTPCGVDDPQEAHLTEARLLASLDHPRIIPVLDVGRTADGRDYLVSKYVEGHDLEFRIGHAPPTSGESARWIALIADALDYAHRAGVIHRDIKPANILLDRNGDPLLADFGLARHERRSSGGWQLVGTPAYMSPEQARGEGHLVGARSDVFSLGVVFYELLTGVRPFAGADSTEVLRQVKRCAPRPPSHVVGAIDRELERICLRAMAKRVADRYASACDMAGDLHHYLSARGADAPASAAPAAIVPKGLRSFDGADRESFLELLPGPRDRHGLPESVRFWKERIETDLAEPSFRVGLVYGPSGCGKSSFVKAGLLPQLNGRLRVVSLDASPQGTERRLHESLVARLPELPGDRTLADTLAAIRRAESDAPGPVLIVLDQFEKWLSVPSNLESSELVEALRQCDGRRLKCLLCVRDEFWVAVSRFLAELDVNIVAGNNASLVDLFDRPHAIHVLTAFGRAFGCLPRGELRAEQSAFVARAVDELAVDDRVICVRLALLAEMIKNRPWSGATLRQLGGMEGIGVAFLEESLGTRARHPAARRHGLAAQRVLGAFLEERVSELLGSRRSDEELRRAAGYEDRPRDYAELLDLLDSELRLITPVEVDAPAARAGGDGSAGRHFQLTHDYLVASVRQWLTLKQKHTRRGRAALRLAECARWWHARPERRYLPTFWETVGFAALTTGRSWTDGQRRMMRAAAALYGARAGILAVLLAAAVVAGLVLHGESVRQRQATHAAQLVARLLDAKITEVPRIVEEIHARRPWAMPLLEQAARRLPEGSSQQLNARLALLPVDAAQLEHFAPYLLEAPLDEHAVLVPSLVPHRAHLAERLWPVVEDPESRRAERLRAAGALAAYWPEDPRWKAVAETVAGDLVAIDPSLLGYWKESLRPVAPRLIEPLCRRFRDNALEPLPRSLATTLLADYASADVSRLCSLIVDADERQFDPLFEAVWARRGPAIAHLEGILRETAEPRWPDTGLPARAPPLPSDAHQWFAAADGWIDDHFAFCQTMPVERAGRCDDRLRAAGYRLLCFRPFPHDDQLLVAAVWTRDGREGRLVADLTPEEIDARDRELRLQGFQPADVCGYLCPAENGTRAARYAVVWEHVDGADPESVLYAGVPAWQEAYSHDAPLTKRGLIRTVRTTLVDDEGRELAAGIWKRPLTATPPETRWYRGISPGFRCDMYAGLLLVDTHVAPWTASRNLPQEWEAQVARADAVLASDPENIVARFDRAAGLYLLERNDESLADWDLILRRFPTHEVSHGYRALVHARLKHEAQALEDLEFYVQYAAEDSEKPYVSALCHFYLGNADAAHRLLDEWIRARPDDPLAPFGAARACSMASAHLRADARRAGELADQALAMLELAVARGFGDLTRVETEPSFGPLDDHPRFAALLNGAAVHRQTAVWIASSKRASAGVTGVDPEQHLARCRELAVSGYRPVSISVAEVRPGRPLIASSAWHRPLVPADERELLARQQAAAAVTLLMLGHPGPAWPLLRHDPAGWVRNHLISLLRRTSQPEMLARRMAVETDISARRALVLALGGFDHDAWPAGPRRTIGEQLLEIYRDDPDPGLHAAAGWLLRRWGHDLTDVDRALREDDGDRRWLVNSQGQTMAVIEGPVEFMIGSPAWESRRRAREFQFRCRIGRSYAMADSPVTVEQFLAFRPSQIYGSRSADQPDSPINGITWTDAAAYCNWLSRQEGLPEDQYCYMPNDNGDYAVGMRMAPDYLERTGYRLPTDAEWEYACRAGSTTARPFGETTALTSEYAWCRGAARPDKLLPVRRLKPNDFGLFDMLGNVHEWCQDFGRDTPPACSDGRPVDDEPGTAGLLADQLRVVRGGCYMDLEYAMRSAFRQLVGNGTSSDGLGFRVARTIHRGH